jgi:K+-sensing histidine kinase KdpD
MGGFTAGLVAGCLLGVCGTFLLLSVGAALSEERVRLFRLRSLTGTVLSTALLLFIAAICHRLSVGMNASILLLLLAVLVVSRVEGLLNGLIATAIATLILAWSLPPNGSMMVKSSSDRLALALFLLIATVGTRLIGRREDSQS